MRQIIVYLDLGWHIQEILLVWDVHEILAIVHHNSIGPEAADLDHVLTFNPQFSIDANVHKSS